MADEIEIRDARGLDELQQCVDLQEAIWQYEGSDIVPRRLFLLASKIGGQVIGAFASGRMVGFSFSLPAYRDGQAYLHSHMLAVLPEHRNAGLGRRLKLAQRTDALARGIERIEWTFDPLEIKNAYLNLSRLGAISRRYEANFYGPSSSPLQGGLPTDRLYAEWWLRSPRVLAALEGATFPVTAVEEVKVPHQIADWKKTPGMQASARATQEANCSALMAAFGRGLVASGYRREDDGTGVFLLGDASKAGLSEA